MVHVLGPLAVFGTPVLQSGAVLEGRARHGDLREPLGDFLI